MKTLLDLGAGDKPYTEKGYKTTALDIYDFGEKPEYKGDVEFINHNLLEPLPFEDNSVDKLWTHHTLEHLPHQLEDNGGDALVFVMNEIGRVLKPTCEAHIIVPWVKHTNAWRHPAHYRYFNKDLFNWFSHENTTPDHEAYGYIHKMHLVKNWIQDECHVYAIFIGL